MRISEHFDFEEFSSRDYHLLTPMQTGMLDNLCKSVLEPLRKFCGMHITIISGIRFPSDNNRLRREGYNPSETSDHLFGNVTKLRDPAKVKRFGRYYSYSVGACDIVPEIGTKQLWDEIKPYFDRANNLINLPQPIGSIRIGQLIYEMWEDKSWIHVSNPVDLIYSFKVSRILTQYRICFLQTLDGGKIYESV